MNCSLIDDARAWNSVLLSLPYAHVLQAWQWGEVKARHGWTPNRLLWEHNGPVAAAQILRRRVPRTPWSVLYVPKGPALDYTDAGQVDAILDALEAYARRFRAILIKIDPDVVLWDASNPVVQALERRGWRPSTQQIQFRNTALLDISRPLDDLLATMKSKTRYNIRLAARKGVTVRAGTVADVPCFYRMYAETGRRDGFITRSFEYYCHTWETFLREGMAHMLLAEVGETSEPIAGLILFRFGRTAWYMYGASTSQHRNRMPNYALQWEAIRWARSVGCTVYDLWGAPDALDENDPMWGVWRFKEGLGAHFTPHIGAYDFVTSRLLYWAYEIVWPRYLERLRARARATDE